MRTELIQVSVVANLVANVFDIGTHVYSCKPLKHLFCAAADQPLKPADTGVAEGGDHERGGGQEQEKAENEENNAGERGDG